MTKMIKNFLHNFNQTKGVTFFKNPNNLYYNIFNYYLRKKIVSITNEMKEFHYEGYFKNKFNISNDLNILKRLLNQQNPERNKKNIFLYELNLDVRNEIKRLINNNFSQITNEFKKYFKRNISIIDVSIKRNYSLENFDLVNKSKEVEFFNNYFHCDHYIGNYFKLFINLHDVSEDHGPLEVFSIQNTKKFVSESNYKNRNNYNKLNSKYLYKNIGSHGDSLFCSTTMCLHRASVPKEKKFRDMLFVTFAASKLNQSDNLFHFEKDYFESVWRKGKKLRSILCKPIGIKRTFKNFINF
jgi:hypothetical protein